MWALRYCVRALRIWVFVVFLLGFLIAQDASERAALLHPGVLSDGQFYSPPESVAGSYVHVATASLYCHLPLPSEGKAGKGWRGGGACLFVPSMNCSKANWHVNQRLFSFLKTKPKIPLCTERLRGNIKLRASDNYVLTADHALSSGWGMSLIGQMIHVTTARSKDSLLAFRGHE